MSDANADVSSCWIGGGGWLYSRNLDDDFPHGAAAGHSLVRLEKVFEGEHGVGEMLDLAYGGSQWPIKERRIREGGSIRTLRDELE